MIEHLASLLGPWILGGVSAGAKTFWLPRQSSDIAADVDWNWDLVYWMSMFFFVLVTFCLVYFTLRYRARAGHKTLSDVTHNTPLEVTWSVIPTLLVVVLFWNGYTTYLDMATPPQNAYEILVHGQKWNWSFTYPNGYVDANLHAPMGTPVRLVLSAEDVMHAFFVPEFRIKRDIIPGRYSKLWFTALETGEFDVFCAEYCGTSHSAMLAKAIIHEQGEFDAWLEEASDFLSKLPPAEAGELLYNQRGCKQCHSVNGDSGTGPTFLGVYGSSEALKDGGSVEVEENYIRESILEPQAKVVAGYEPVMPTYKGRLKDAEISAIIEYMKTLAQ